MILLLTYLFLSFIPVVVSCYGYIFLVIYSFEKKTFHMEMFNFKRCIHNLKY